MYRTPLSLLLITATTLAGAQICDVSITHQINGNQVQYFGTSPDNPTQWSWFFNGGTPLTSNQQNPVVTYSGTGQFICALSVSGGPNSCSPALSQDQDTVTIIATGVHERADAPMRITFTEGRQVDVLNTEVQRARIVLYDLTGRTVGIVFEGMLPIGRSTFTLPEAPGTGLQLLAITGAHGTIVRKFLAD